MLATLNNCLAIFASNHEDALFDNDTQRHANKGAQQIAVRRLSVQQTHVMQTCQTAKLKLEHPD